jgi:hypothetical protein
VVPVFVENKGPTAFRPTGDRPVECAFWLFLASEPRCFSATRRFVFLSIFWHGEQIANTLGEFNIMEGEYKTKYKTPLILFLAPAYMAFAVIAGI